MVIHGGVQRTLAVLQQFYVQQVHGLVHDSQLVHVVITEMDDVQEQDEWQHDE